MDLSQWIICEANGGVRSVLAKPGLSEISIGTTYHSYGDLVNSTSLVNPLLFALENTLFRRLEGLTVHVKSCSMCLTLHNDDGTLDPATFEGMSHLKAIGLFTEYASLISEIVEMTGFKFILFGKTLVDGQFCFDLENRSAHGLGFVRGLTLMRSACEILAYERGFLLSECRLISAEFSADLLGDWMNKLVS